jgi:hypothetical protein
MAASWEHKEAILVASKAGRVAEIAAILGKYGPEDKKKLANHSEVCDHVKLFLSLCHLSFSLYPP